MNARRLGPMALAAALLGACAPIPRPSVLDELDRVRAGAAAAESRRHAPGAFAHAEKLRRDAHAALAAGDQAGAQILGEQAIAAHAHAHAFARVARAEAAVTEAKAAHSDGEASLARLEAEQAQVEAELNALDMRLNVARDAQPVVPSGKADPAREKARLAAVKSLALQARMLCGAARLLLSPAQPEGPLPGGAELGAQLDAATAALKKLDAELAGAAGSPRTTPAPIDQASRVRAGCLAALTAARRAATPVTRAPGVGDALLSALSAAGTWSPVRDDRGVVVTLRGLFAGPKLTPAGEARLRDLARVAAAHPSFPVAVVVHTDRDVSSREEPALTARAEAVVHVLKSAQVASDAGAPPPNPRIEPFVAGSAAPVVDPSGSDRARNARVEIIFVTPETI